MSLDFELINSYKKKVDLLRDHPDSKLITSLVEISKNIQYGEEFIKYLIEKLINKVSPGTFKRPIFYLMDALMKNSPAIYPNLISKHLSPVLLLTFVNLPIEDAIKLEKVFNTWKERNFFPPDFITRLINSIKSYITSRTSTNPPTVSPRHSQEKVDPRARPHAESRFGPTADPRYGPPSSTDPRIRGSHPSTDPRYGPPPTTDPRYVPHPSTDSRYGLPPTADPRAVSADRFSDRNRESRERSPRYPPYQESRYQPYQSRHPGPSGRPAPGPAPVINQDLLRNEMLSILHEISNGDMPNLTLEELAHKNPQLYSDIYYKAEERINLNSSTSYNALPPKKTYPTEEIPPRKRNFELSNQEHPVPVKKIERNFPTPPTLSLPTDIIYRTPYNPIITESNRHSFVNSFISNNSLVLDISRMKELVDKLNKKNEENKLINTDINSQDSTIQVKTENDTTSNSNNSLFSETFYQKVLPRLNNYLENLLVLPELPSILQSTLPAEFAIKQAMNERYNADKIDLKNLKVPEFKDPNLPERYDIMLKAMYDDRPHQYALDGLRFKTLKELTEHTFKYIEKKKILNKNIEKNLISFREYYCHISQWITDFNTITESDQSNNPSMGELNEHEESKESSNHFSSTSSDILIPADENFLRCPISKESFNQVWDDENGEFMYKNACKILFITKDFLKLFNSNNILLINYSNYLDNNLLKLTLPFNQSSSVVSSDFLSTFIKSFSSYNLDLANVTEESLEQSLRYMIVNRDLVLEPWIRDGKISSYDESLKRFSLMGESGEITVNLLKFIKLFDENIEQLYVFL